MSGKVSEADGRIDASPPIKGNSGRNYGPYQNAEYQVTAYLTDDAAEANPWAVVTHRLNSLFTDLPLSEWRALLAFISLETGRFVPVATLHQS